jgi:hypothetical protein
LTRPRRSDAKTSGSVYPAINASSIARPPAPSISVSTPASLMWHLPESSGSAACAGQSPEPTESASASSPEAHESAPEERNCPGSARAPKDPR